MKITTELETTFTLVLNGPEMQEIAAALLGYDPEDDDRAVLNGALYSDVADALDDASIEQHDE